MDSSQKQTQSASHQQRGCVSRGKYIYSIYTVCVSVCVGPERLVLSDSTTVFPSFYLQCLTLTSFPFKAPFIDITAAF